MFSLRTLFGVAVGGALVYFLDPRHGEERRERLRRWWDRNREPMLNQAATVATTAQDRVSETAASVGDKVTGLQSRVRGSS